MVLKSLMPKEEKRLDKRSFTVNERILLHLKESGSASHELGQPALITQEGIATALGIRVNHVSRAVKTLQKQNCVREATSRVKGEVRKRKVYLITEEGMVVANRVMADISDMVLSVRDSRQRIREMTTVNAKQLLSPPRTFTSMLAALDANGILDIYRTKMVRKRKEAVSNYNGAPPETNFFGRRQELARLKAWLQAKKPPIMALTGDEGIGKSALAMRTVKQLEGKRPIFWYTFSDRTTVQSLMDALSSFLASTGRHELYTLAQKNKVDARELKQRLESSLVNLGAVMVLDHVPAEPEELAGVVMPLIEASMATGCQILLTSTELPAWKRDMKVHGILDELILEGLDQSDCRKLAPDMHDKEFKKAYKLAKGNPLEIKLMVAYVEDLKAGEKLTPEERALIRYLRAVHNSNLK